jgi:hypothetical protein
MVTAIVIMPVLAEARLISREFMQVRYAPVLRCRLAVRWVRP